LWADQLTPTPFGREQVSLFKPLEVKPLSESTWFLNRPVTRSSAKPWAAGVHGEDLLGTLSLSASGRRQDRRLREFRLSTQGTNKRGFDPPPRQAFFETSFPAAADDGLSTGWFREQI
jgi:hypothetical protein